MVYAIDKQVIIGESRLHDVIEKPLNVTMNLLPVDQNVFVWKPIVVLGQGIQAVVRNERSKLEMWRRPIVAFTQYNNELR
jgi:hypothetical protein